MTFDKDDRIGTIGVYLKFFLMKNSVVSVCKSTFKNTVPISFDGTFTEKDQKELDQAIRDAAQGKNIKKTNSVYEFLAIINA